MLFATAIFCGLLTGCQYYRVRDVSSGKEYITNNWSMAESGWTGTTKFNDLKTGKQVTLQSFEKEAISENVAKAEIGSGKN